MATLEQEFQAQKAWIAGCEDVDALMDRIADLRDDVRVAIREGHALLRMRAGDLVELAENRVIGLKARALRASTTKKQAPPQDGRELGGARRMAEERAAREEQERSRREREQRDRQAAERRDREERERQAKAQREAEQRDREQRDAARRLDEEERAAATRLANAQAAETEARTAVLRAQAEAARTKSAAPPPATVTTPAGNPASSPRTSGAPQPPTATLKPLSPPAAPEIAEADRLALASVGRWPPTGPAPGHPFYSRDQDWPPEWTLTGLDLAHLRGRIRVTQRVLAAQLRISTAELARLEGRPAEKVGPAMQIALRRAMDVVEAQARQRRAEREGERAAATPVQVVTVPEVTPVRAALPTAPALEALPPSRAPATAELPAGFTGADLARLRADRRLSQRQFAEALGVGYGMVAKAEVAAADPLGERMRGAVGAYLGRDAGTAAA